MVIKIIWSDEAKKTFDNNVRYIQKEWTDKEVILFLKRTELILSRIHLHPEFYRPSAKSKKVRRARVNKYIMLYYLYKQSDKTATLLSFWHEKQNPKRLKF